MAKGRRLSISRSERYLGTYGGHSYSNGESESHELREEDVWSTMDEGGADSAYYGNGEVESAWDSRAASVHPPPVPRRDRQVGGLTLAFEESEGRTTSSRIVHQLRPQDGFTAEAPPRRQRQIASSAPVNVPDWRKILRVNSVESMNESDEGEFEEESNSAVDPPHEYLARSRKKHSTSVFEGVGRTLKGRDLRRLRDTVWSQTGFDG